MPSDTWKIEVDEGPFTPDRPQNGSGVIVTARRIDDPRQPFFRGIGGTLQEALRDVAEQLERTR